MSRVEAVQERLRDAGVDGLLITDIDNIGWLTGFTGSFAHILLSPDGGAFITDSRYTIQAEEQVRGLPVRSFRNPQTILDVLSEETARAGVHRIGFEPSIAFGTWQKWTDAMPGVNWQPVTDVVEPLRMIKTEEEIDAIRRACALTDAALTHVERVIQPGVSEYDIGLEIEFYIRRQGGKLAFDPVVAGGENSARPHARATERKLQVGDFLTLDFGALLDGYCADLTRTFVIGEATPRHEEIYGLVLEAQVAAVEMMMPGVNGRDVDAMVRAKFGEKGYAEYFGHGLGHGLGRVVHDLGRLSPTTDQPIEVGQVWTIEPGIYIPGFGGVRIEDDIVVREGGAEILNRYPKDLRILPAR
ncbi:MAG TPA: Xaa-Pro peptidase family protein [Fimbriimonadaceae bacterium]|nr:Xaa-Pro peptidase family protein [Fimbriimonadaceae bacterium]